MGKKKKIKRVVLDTADFIVSGDRYLCNLKEYRTVKIISPSEFLAYFKEKA